MSNPQRGGSNGLGIAGFIVSLVGILSCGFLSPIGLLFSFFALFKRPRGFAIAGFILGLIGSLWIIIILVIIFAIFGLSIAAVSSMGLGGMIEVIGDSIKIHGAVVQYYNTNGAVPSTLSVLSLDSDTLTDPWGNPYRYEIDVDGRHYTISTSGADGVWDTDDDFSFDQDAAQQ
ncbi:MAG: type II secretion system protein GspG [Phycisphaerales bacterium]